MNLQLQNDLTKVFTTIDNATVFLDWSSIFVSEYPDDYKFEIIEDMAQEIFASEPGNENPATDEIDYVFVTSDSIKNADVKQFAQDQEVEDFEVQIQDYLANAVEQMEADGKDVAFGNLGDLLEESIQPWATYIPHMA